MKGVQRLLQEAFAGVLPQTPLRLEYGALRQQLTASGITHTGPAEVSSAVCQIRHSKLPDPAVIGNAGSFFKNPTILTTQAEALRSVYPNIVNYPVDGQHEKLAAGWLIEHCGWKGYSDGDAGVHQNQALVLVNYGLATGSQYSPLPIKSKTQFTNVSASSSKWKSVFYRGWELGFRGWAEK